MKSNILIPTNFLPPHVLRLAMPMLLECAYVQTESVQSYESRAWQADSWKAQQQTCSLRFCAFIWGLNYVWTRFCISIF